MPVGERMKLSTRSRYGARMMLELAMNYDKGFTQLRDIAERQNISMKYLEQIILPLKKAGYVTSTRGARGGHSLARNPREVSVGEVVALLETGGRVINCSDDPDVCDRSDTCVMRMLWKEAVDAMYERLNSVTFQDLVDRNECIP